MSFKDLVEKEKDFARNKIIESYSARKIKKEALKFLEELIKGKYSWPKIDTSVNDRIGFHFEEIVKGRTFVADVVFQYKGNYCQGFSFNNSIKVSQPIYPQTIWLKTPYIEDIRNIEKMLAGKYTSPSGNISFISGSKE